MNYKNLSFVPVDKIPKGEDVPLDNLLEIFKLAVHMEAICLKHDGIGLSANQLGIPWKFFIVLKETGNEYFLNCSYEGIGEKNKSIEGCLSLRDKDGKLRRFEVERFDKIRFKGKQLKLSHNPQLILEDVDKEASGLFGTVYQHEIDHFSLITIDQIGKEIRILGT